MAAAVALETLKIYEERDIPSAMCERHGPGFQNGLRAFADHPLVGEVRGIGLVAGVELVRDKATKKSFEASDGVGATFANKAQDHGLIVRAVPGDTITLCPPLIIKGDEIDDLLGRFGKALDDTAVWLSKRG